ncbi:hypothetical protein DSECCO2_538310 [anaerobic digester metagenome]
MNISIKSIHDRSVALVESEQIEFSTVQDMLDVMAGCAWDGADTLVISEHQLNPSFFDLKSGLAGEMLQKFSNYRMKLGVLGDFSKYESKSLRDFIRESNRSGHIAFAVNIEEALQMLG